MVFHNWGSNSRFTALKAIAKESCEMQLKSVSNLNKKIVDLNINSTLLANLECVFVYTEQPPNALTDRIAPHRIKGVFDAWCSLAVCLERQR